MAAPLVWRVTPKSRAYVAIIPPTVLPGVVTVQHATQNELHVGITEKQAHTLATWLNNLPPDVIRPTACETFQLKHTGSFAVIAPDMTCQQASALQKGMLVNIRVVATVHKIGPLYKTVLQVIDVLRHDITRSNNAPHK